MLLTGVTRAQAPDKDAKASKKGQDQRAAKADGTKPGAKKGPSEDYQDSIRRTVERRRQRRANRGQAALDSAPVGAIVPWPMPPVLIIRHTPQVHDEIESFLGLLRK
jgi:hypothetical protein